MLQPLKFGNGYVVPSHILLDMFQPYFTEICFKCPINNNPAFAKKMGWRRTGDKPYSEPIVAYFTDVYMPHSVNW